MAKKRTCGDGRSIVIEGARQNNLKGIDLRLPLNELIVVTGVSGSGKSSLAFDTVYSEGQRRYVETFSPYARQFLDRMDKPRVDRIEGIPPAIAIDQTNPVRTSRSTVGTMTELNDHIKLLYARAAHLHCRDCGKEVQRDSAESAYERLMRSGDGAPRAIVTFSVPVPDNFSEEEVLALLAKQGYHRIHRRSAEEVEVVQDRVRLERRRKARIVDALESALARGRGRVAVHVEAGKKRTGQPARFSSALHCPDCDIHYDDPVPNLRGVCYILDEPTIGLHTRDNRMLLDTLRQLERKGNTVVYGAVFGEVAGGAGGREKS